MMAEQAYVPLQPAKPSKAGYLNQQPSAKKRARSADDEAGASNVPAHGYTSEDFRRELSRVKRRRAARSIVLIVLSLAIAAAVAYYLLFVTK